MGSEEPEILSEINWINWEDGRQDKINFQESEKKIMLASTKKVQDSVSKKHF